MKTRVIICRPYRIFYESINNNLSLSNLYLILKQSNEKI